MQLEKWTKWTNQTPSSDLYYEVVFIDSKNRICDAKIRGDDEIWSRADLTVLAARSISVVGPAAKKHKTPNEPKQPTKTFYWNWVTHKLWPETIPVPPNPHLPFFKIEIEINNPDKIYYTVQGTDYYNKTKLDWKKIRCVKPEVDSARNIVYITS
jgi:hypothetical protein